MVASKTIAQEHQLTVTLTDKQYELLEAFAAEKGISDLTVALPEVILEMVGLSDKLWDAQFARSPELLKKMAQDAIEDNRAGLTEDMP